MLVLRSYVETVAVLLGPIPPPNVSWSVLESDFSPLTCVWVGLYVVSLILCAVSIDKLIQRIRFHQGKYSETILYMCVSVAVVALLFATLPPQSFRLLEIALFLGLVVFVLVIRYLLFKK